jgi:hypothetical protein
MQGQEEARKVNYIVPIIKAGADDSHIDALMQSITLKSLPIQIIVIDATTKPSASKRKSSA